MRPLGTLLLAFASLFSVMTASAEPTYLDLRTARPDGRSIAVSDFTLARDVCRFSFEQGRFHLISPSDGPAFAAVFVGKGSYNLVPATENERRHIAIVLADETAETITDSFESLVVFFTDDTLAELERHSASEPGSADPRAIEIYE